MSTKDFGKSGWFTQRGAYDRKPTADRVAAVYAADGYVTKIRNEHGKFVVYTQRPADVPRPLTVR